jgi:hypothetical protein
MTDTVTVALKTGGFLTAAVATYKVAPWLVVVFAACAGAQWALSRTDTPSLRKSLSAFFRYVSASLVLSWGIELLISRLMDNSSVELLAMAAFWAAAIGDRIHSLVDSAFNLAGRLFRTASARTGAGDSNSRGE